MEATARLPTGIRWSVLRADPLLRLCLLVLGILGVPFFVPLLSPETLTHFSENLVDLLQFPMVILAFGYGLGRIEHPEQRRFAVYVMAAIALWWAVRLSYIVLPGAVGTPLGDIGGDLSYMLFYFFIVLAIEARPHLPAGWSEADPTRRLRNTSIAAVLFTMLGYFVIIPSALNYAAYNTWIPSLYMYVALDLYLVARFFHAVHGCKSGPFRAIYLLLGLTAVCWAIFDVLECLMWAGVLELPSGNAIDLLWWIPIPLLLVAGRGLHVATTALESDESSPRFDCPEPGTLRAVAPQVVVAFVIPAMHLAFYSAGLLDTESRSARDILVLLSLPVLGSLLVLQQIILERANRSLQSELQQVNAQLHQSQKMEAIGRLAGGVAHDFNNLLTAIMGHTGLALKRLPPDTPVRNEINQIEKASGRAAQLIKQLLAFGRRQVLQPEVIDLNAVVTDMQEMLQRLIGEDIALVTELADDLGLVNADRSQLEQVIMNLCINARDAMPQGGRLSLITSNEHFPRVERAGEETEDPLGRQVVLAVCDTGIGMSPETQERAFEPFFTTKARDKGTGLGLSTVYGIVRQSGGHILLRSKPGHGTTFRIYLPRREQEAEPSSEAVQHHETSSNIAGGETILLAEDEPSVRELVRDILETHSYRVLEAADGREALQVYERYNGTIDLLLTDVIMPVMGGASWRARSGSTNPI